MSEKKRIEEKIAQLMKIDELEMKISALQAEKEALISEISGVSEERPKKRGPKKLSEMTTEELAKHEAAVAARKLKKSVAPPPSLASSSDAEDSVTKKKYKNWTSWALEKEFKTGDSFYVPYKGVLTTLTGLWENNVYYLCSDLIAPIPEGWSNEKGLHHGYGVAVKKNSPTMAAAFVKASCGAPLGSKGFHPDASPSDVKTRVGDKLVGVYDI